MNAPSPEASEIPFVPQSNEGKRTCGAACLSMVYRALGNNLPLDSIWPRISKPNKYGVVSSVTHLMVSDALARGLAASAIQSLRPLQSLQACRQFNVYAILNHRLRSDDSAGHYTVLVEVDDWKITVNDPLYGPNRSLELAYLLDLWQPASPTSEIAGNVLIGIAEKNDTPAACSLCGAAIPTHVNCPRCTHQVFLQPHSLFGCIDIQCMARLWRYLCCPACDHLWTFDLSEEERARTPGIHFSSKALKNPPGPIDLAPAFAELEKFCAHVLQIAGASGDARVTRHIDFLRSSKDRLLATQKEQTAYRLMRQTQMAKLMESARQKAAEHAQKLKSLSTPAPPLDGQALGRALLKELGFTA